MNEALSKEIMLGVKSASVGCATRPLPNDAEHTAPVGSWVKLPYPDLRGRPIAQVREVRLTDLYLPELNERGELQPEKRSYVHGYVARLQAGEQAPNLQIVEMEDGRLRVVDGHRRAVSALRAGRETVRATVSPLIETAEGKVPLTMELAREMVALRDIEEPVGMGARPTGGGGLIHLRLFLNEQFLERIFPLMDSNKPERDTVDIPCADLGVRIERGDGVVGSDQSQWIGEIPLDRALMRVFHDGFLVYVKDPETGDDLSGDFVTESSLKRSAARYDERLRHWRSEHLSALMEEAMTSEEAPVRTRPSLGPGML